LDLAQVATILNTSVEHVEDLIKQERLEAMNLGSKDEPFWRVKESDVEDIAGPDDVEPFITDDLRDDFASTASQLRTAFAERLKSMLDGEPRRTSGFAHVEGRKFSTNNDDGTCLRELVAWIKEHGGETSTNGTDLLLGVGKDTYATADVSDWIMHHGDGVFSICSDDHFQKMFGKPE
jgi:hypothetical protein